MQPMCKDVEELMQLIFQVSRMNDYHQGKAREKGFMVTTKVRKEFLTSDYQGRMVFDGKIIEINFKNLGGGVWHVTF